MSRREYTIGELAEMSGVTPRTVRYYVSQGILPPGTKSGHQSLYADEHVELIHEIKRLQDQYLPLKVIRRMLAGDEDDQGRGGASELGAMAVREEDTRYMLEDAPSEPRRPRAESVGRPQDWVRIEIAPGVEIHYQRAEIAGQEHVIDDLIDRAKRVLA